VPILLLVDPAEGGDELCSVAPPEVSALPDGGMVADLDASGGTVFAVGGLVGGNESSVAIAGVNPMASPRSLHLPPRFKRDRSILL